MKAILAAMAFGTVAGAAHAATYTIGFENSANPDTGSHDSAGPVSWDDGNKFLYGQLEEYIVLGDDGFTNQITFSAAPGTTFSPVSMDLSGALWVERSPGVADPDDAGSTIPSGVWDDYASDFVTVTGYSGGLAVATQTITPTGVLTFGTAYENIDAFSVSLLFGNAWAFGPELGADGYYYRCGSGGVPSSSCVYASIDNLVVTTPAPVPLPAAAPLLLGALGALGWLARRRPRVTA